MPSRHLWASVALLLAAIGWAIGLFFAPEPWAAPVAGVIGVGLLVVASVSVAGIMIESSRLGYWLGVFDLSLMLGIASVRTVDTLWVVAILITALAGLLMADRRLGGWIRRERPAGRVPARATALGLSLLVAPILTASTQIHRASGGIVWLSLASWAVLAWFVRRLPGAVWAVRLAVPLLLLGLVALESPGRWVWGSVTLAAAVLAWTSSVRLAIRPLVERGTRVTIPPELLPDDVRRAAGIDRDRK